jgi:sulfite reductase (ferredoxin)
VAKSVEHIKAESRHLRGSLYEEVFELFDGGVSEESRQLMKFFGMYLQDDRDQRRAQKEAGLEPAYAFMVRIALAGGRLTAEQYLAIDALSEEIGRGDFRLTSRQAIQVHGIAKRGLSPLVTRLHEVGTTTLAGCGDVERNIMACPAPGGIRDQVRAIAESLSRELKPRTGAYLELFVEGRKVYDIREEEPLYGDTYLPRKFKTGFAIEGDNCTDVLSDDIGIVAHGDQQGNLESFTVMAGGGLGHSHGIAKTRAFLARALGRVLPEDLEAVVKAIMTIQRDYGNREDRRYARMKYLVDAWGLEAFRAEVEARAGVAFLPAVPHRFDRPEDHLGWHAEDRYLGLFVPEGRVAGPVRQALFEIVSAIKPDFSVTPQQNLLLLGIDEQQKAKAGQIWRNHGLSLAEALAPVRRISMACVALPTCGLALAEAERVFPDVMRQFQAEWARLGLAQEPILVRMTGCPNNCVRSEMAEIGFVGSSPGKYHLYVGGSPSGTRLAEKFKERVPFEALIPTVRPLLEWYANERKPRQSFGDWAHEVGMDSLQQRLQEVVS